MLNTQQIHDAVVAAAEPHGLTVVRDDALGGACIKGRRNEAYVYPRRDGGFAVDKWQKKADDAEVQQIGDLDTAVAEAVAHALGR